MATFTVSATGGNWSSGTTWVGGVAPNPTGDNIIVPSGAGNLTVDINRSCLTIIFQTGYVNTFTINNGIILTVAGTTITLIAGMIYNQTTTGILNTNGNQAAITITFAGITIPNLTIGRSTNGQTQTVTISGTTPTIKNLVIGNTSGGTATLVGTAITITASLNNTQGVFTNSTGQITFLGACTISCTGTASISGGFIVGSGNSLQMLSNINLGAGTITFTGTGALINTGLFTLSCPGAVTFNTSTVTWYNVTFQSTIVYALQSNLNISNNLTLGTGNQVTGSLTINVGGSLLSTSGGLNLSSTTLNMIGSGNINIPSLTFGTLNINGTGTYTIGSSGFPTLTASGLTINLVGTSTASVYSTTTHTLSSAGSMVLRTNNTATGAAILGGSQIIWGNISLTSNQPNTLIYNTTALGNLISNNDSINGVGITLYVAGNLSTTGAGGLAGTATIELNGSTNKTWGVGGYQINVVVNKTGVGTKVTTAGTLTWGGAGRTLTINSQIDFITSSTILTLSGTPLTINDTFGNNPFFRVNIPASTLNINGNPLRINENLTLTGLGATFAGAFGWDCNNLICAAAGTFNITLQQGVTYRTRTAVSITGGVATTVRPTMRSSLANNYAIWTLDFGATQSLIYVNAIDIDSLGGQTIWSFGVIPLTNLIRTRNWNPGVPLRTVAYTFVN
jgi:hypothetical protein